MQPALYAALMRLRDGPAADVERALGSTVSVVRAHFGVDAAFIGEFAGSDCRLRVVDAGGDDGAWPVGGPAPIGDDCRRRLAGGSAWPLAAPRPAEGTAAAGPRRSDPPEAGACVAVPVRFSDGSVYGVLGCLSRAPRPDLCGRDVALLETVAAFIAESLERDARQQGAAEAKRLRIREAIDTPGLRTLVQPIIRLGSGVVAGHEALTRFTADQRSPDAWFREAREVGLGVELERAALRAALARLPERPTGTYLAVNMSSTALLAEGTLDVLLAHPLAGVVIELTEHAAVEDYPLLGNAAAALQEAGARIAVDEAGTGYASLHHILQVRPNIIKLDMSVVCFVSRDVARQALVESFVLFAGRCGIDVVAEGVEYADDAARLLELGVEYAQGYSFGRPAPAFTTGFAESDWTALGWLP